MDTDIHIRMTRTWRAVACSLLFLSMGWVPDMALAKDMRGKLGLGATGTLSGAQGMTVRYWPMRSVGVEFLMGAAVMQRDSGSDRVALHFGLEINYVLREIGPANLLAGVRGVIGYVNDGEGGTGSESAEEASVQFAAEAPLTVEYHFSDAFSVQLAAGLLFTVIPKDGAVLSGGVLKSWSDASPSTVYAIGPAGLFGAAGFTYYF